jgi:hypothetical protein
MPYSELNPPGAEFGAELDLWNLGSQDNSSTETLPDHVWREWINLPSDTEDPRQPDPQSLSPISSLDTLYDPPSEVQNLHTLQPNHPPHDALPAESNTEKPDHMIWGTAPLGVDETLPRHAAASTTLSVVGAGSQDQLSPEHPSSMPRSNSSLHCDPADPWSGGIAIRNRQTDPSVLDEGRTFCSSQQTSLQPFPTASQDTIPHHEENGFQGHDLLLAEFGSPLVRPACLQQSEPSQDADRSNEHNIGGEDNIMYGIHAATTNELPWEKGCTLPAETSQCAFHTFSFDGQPVEQKKRKPRSKRRLQEMKKMREVGSCLRCRGDKKRVSSPISMPLASFGADVMPNSVQ